MKRLILIGLVPLLFGCVRYIEQPTPPGPPNPIPYQPTAAANIAPVPAPLPSQDRPAPAAVAPVAQATAAVASSATFADAYRQAGKPRITLFYNRHISDPVNEWKNQKTDRTAYQHNFENQMNRTFIVSKARIVDRPTMIHLFTTDSGKTSDELQELLERKKIEIGSLRKYTDIFVEIHTKKDPNAPSGYLFRAVAKEIQTGQIIADTLCNNFGGGKPYIAAGSDGYEFKKTLPDMSNAATILATHLQRDLASAWE